MEANKERVGCLVMGLEEIQRLVEKKNTVLDDPTIEAIVGHMNQQTDNVFVQIAACQLLRLIVPKSQPESFVFSSAPSKAVMMAMRSHSSSAELQEVRLGPINNGAQA